MSNLHKETYNSVSHEWMTPAKIYRSILDFRGIEKYGMDVCASKANVPAFKHITPEMDSLSQNWKGICWLNPPYGRCKERKNRAYIELFIEKAYKESQRNCEVWSILPIRTENKYYHEYIFNAENCFWVMLQGKQGFINPANPEEKIKATLPCMIVYWGANSGYWANKWALEQPLKGAVMKNIYRR